MNYSQKVEMQKVPDSDERSKQKNYEVHLRTDNCKHPKKEREQNESKRQIFKNFRDQQKQAW